MKYLICSILCFSLFISCAKKDEENQKEIDYPSSLAKSTLVNNSNNFGIQLFKETSQSETDINQLISPLSVSVALGMLLNGTEDSATANSIKEVLGFSTLSKKDINETYRALINNLPIADPKVQSKIANSIWANQELDLEQNFVDNNQYYFNSSTQSLDFGDSDAKDIINKWVEDNTNGKIKDLIAEVRPDHALFLINAVYFLADWKYQFDPKNTSKDNFNLKDNSIVSTDFMYSDAIPFEYFSNNEMALVNLPYGKADRFQFTAILPNQDIDQFIQSLDISSLTQWITQANTDHDLEIYLPKFEMDYQIELNNALINMGMGICFTRAADFSNMIKNLPVQVSKVNHKTYIKLDEAGTEAAAATSIEVEVTSVGPSPVSFNKPFVYLIHEKETGAILFIGKMLNPQQ